MTHPQYAANNSRHCVKNFPKQVIHNLKEPRCKILLKERKNKFTFIKTQIANQQYHIVFGFICFYYNFFFLKLLNRNQSTF
jgi:hypothetical protein